MSVEVAVQALYEAAITPDSRSQALQGFAYATGSVGCRFRLQYSGSMDVWFPTSPDLSGFVQDFFEGGWFRIDPRVSRGRPLLEAGRSVVVEHDIATDDERRLSPFYQILLKRHEIPWWAAVGFSVNGRRWCMTMHRSPAQGPFTPSDARGLASVAPQLRGAVSLAERFALAKGQSSIETLERVGYAALVLDNNGQMVLINASAESMLGGDLTLSADRLHARDHESDRRLQTLIDRAVAPRALEAQVPSPEFVRRFEGRPFMVEAMPASGALRDVFRRIAALVVITDLNARPRAPDCLIREAFGLTAAEARLAATLASGEDLRKAAERLGVTRETARGHLKSIFSKTEVNRQSELTALIARLGKKSP